MKAMVAATPPPKTDLPFPSPTRRGGRRTPGRPQRLAFALMLALFAAAGAAAVWNFVRPSHDPWVSVGLIENFPPGTVTSFRAVLDVDGRDGFHIVRLDDGELLALRDRDTHLGDPRAVPSGLRVRRADGLVPRRSRRDLRHGRPTSIRSHAARSRPPRRRGPKRRGVRQSEGDHAGSERDHPGHEQNRAGSDLDHAGGRRLPDRRRASVSAPLLDPLERLVPVH